MALPRMRTAAGVLAEIRAQDPGSEITLYYIRQIILSGRVPVITAGRKKLVNLDSVLELLARGDRVEEPKATGGIRPVKS